MIYLERKGGATVSIASSGFERDTVATSRAFGMPGAPYVVIQDVITSVSPEVSSTAIAEQIDGIIRGLTDPSFDFPDVDLEPEVNRLPGPPLSFEGEDQLNALEKFNKNYLDIGWGDGFPLIPPTRERVDHILTGTSLASDDVIGVLPPGMGIATVEKIAISLAMAGGEPQHLPVMIATVKAIIKLGGRARAWLMSTSPDAPMMLVNGPIVDEIGLNYGKCSFGPGRQSRVNITLGRAMRLTLMNVGHNYPGEMDMDTIGSALKFSLCASESPEPHYWPTFQSSKGLGNDTNTVTAVGIRDIIDVPDLVNFAPEGILTTVVNTLHGGGRYTTYRWSDPDPYDPEGGFGAIVILATDHAKRCAEAGWNKEMVRDFLWGKARVSVAGLQNGFKGNPSWVLPPWRWILDLSAEEAARTSIPAYNKPEQIEIISFGGPAGKSQVMMTNGPSQTVEITDRA